MMVLDMRRNHKAKTVLRLRARSFSPVLVRLILEEVSRYFVKGGSSHWQPADQIEAHHLIKNMDILFANVEGLLQPFPPSLGIEIVSAINFFALSNTTLVRMRMKNHSTLFQTRDQLAFYHVASISRYARISYRLLEQLIDANAHHLDTMTVLLDRLMTAVAAMELDEVEVQIRLIRHLALTDEGQQDELYRVVGPAGAVLANYLCRGHEEAMRQGGVANAHTHTTAAIVAAKPPMGSLSTTLADALTPTAAVPMTPPEMSAVEWKGQASGHVLNCRERRGSASASTSLSHDVVSGCREGDESCVRPAGERRGGGAKVMGGSEPTTAIPLYPGSLMTAIIEWCQSHAAICETVHHSAQRIIKTRLAAMRGIGERGERDRAYLARAARAETERAEHKEAKLVAEFKRLKADVHAQIGYP